MKQVLCILLVFAAAGAALSAQTKPKPAAKAKTAAGLNYWRLSGAAKACTPKPA